VKRFRSKTSFKDAIIMSSSVNRSSSEWQVFGCI
jgi:hypothetical protein